MKIPAIRAKVGIWVYYVATMTYAQIKEHVKKVDDELHKSTALREMLQRSITANYKQIATYIEQQEERFFNSLVLAVYDGDPKWHEVRLDYGDDEEYYNIGLLELTGEEKIFPVDGQHRVEGIKKVLSESRQFNDESISVIFIGHKKDDDGMQRARRLFSTLNRYAKPVSMKDIIALDEDDSVAIATRELIETHPLFEGERIESKTKGKAIPENNKTAFTTVITFYECNFELMHVFLESKIVKNSDGKTMSGNSKAKEYIRFRPEQDELDDYIRLCADFWSAVSSEIECVREYLAAPPSTELFRNKDGGDLPFRPAALVPLVRAAVYIKKKRGCSFSEILKKINSLPLKLSDNIWIGILWDNNNKKMIMGHGKVIELRLIHLYDSTLLSGKETQSLVNSYASATQMRKENAESVLGIYKLS